ncbi:MAG: hypothetical protein QW051_02495 [Candidatus Aenigmatarchaeota archaeon]
MEPKKIGKKDLIYILIIIILCIGLVYSIFQTTIKTSSQKQVFDSIKSVYEKLTESEVEVLSSSDEGNLYKLLLRLKLPTGDVLREVYITKDASYISEAQNVFKVSDLSERLDRERNFTECLRSRNFIVFGQSSEPNTIQQLLIIGNYAKKIYVDCVDANLQVCQQLNITQVPTMFYQGKTYVGVKTREWIESLTGCKY